MRKFLKFRLILFIGLISSLGSCVKKEFDDITLGSISPTIAVPALNTRLDLADMVAIQQSNLNVQTDPDGFLRFLYFEEIISGTAPDYITIPNQTVNENIPGLLLYAGGTMNINVSDTMTLTFSNGEEIDQAILKDGDLVININKTGFQHNIDLQLTFPTVQDSTGSTLVVNVSAPGISNGNITIDLTKTDFDLTLAGTSFNQLPYDAQITISQAGLNPFGGTADFSLGMNNLEYSYMEGYMGSFNVPFNPDTVDLDVFDNAFSGSIFFTDPKARFIFDNSFGIPLQTQINSFIGEQTDGNTIPIVGTYDDVPFPIPGPTLAQVGQTITSTLELNNTNSNIDALLQLSPAPNRAYFQVTTDANPAGPPASNFVTDSSTIRITGEVEIPFEGNVFAFILADTVDKVGGLPDTTEDGYEEINEVTFRFTTENFFPVDAKVQAYFYDSNYVLLDSTFLTNDNLVQSGVLDGTGRVIAPTLVELEAVYDKARYQKIINTDNIVILGTLSTTNGGATPVRLYDNYYLNVDLGLRIDGTINLDDL